jgi:hypothetical protein
MVEPYFRNDNGNSPPVVKLDPKGPELKGPPHGPAQALTATVGQPLTLTLYATDKGNTISQQDQNAAPAPAATATGAARGGRGAAAGRGARGTATAQAPAADDGAAGVPDVPGTAARGGRGGRQDPIRVTWYKHRGPAGDTVKLDPVSPMVVADAEVEKMFEKPGDYTGKATTNATFTEPGEYWLRAQINDASGNGGGGDQCCWSNVLIKVNVRAAAR